MLKLQIDPTIWQRVPLGGPTALGLGTPTKQGQAEAKCFSTPEPAMWIWKGIEFSANLIVVRPCMHFLWKQVV